MPEMDGIQAINTIRNEFPGAKIIVLTTYGGDVQVRRALNAGARGYIFKGHQLSDTDEVVTPRRCLYNRAPS